MMYLFLITLGTASAFCLYFVIACLVAASRENALPDIEDIEVGRMLSDSLSDRARPQAVHGKSGRKTLASPLSNCT